MNEEPYEMRDLFAKDMSGTEKVLHVAGRMLQKFLPNLSAHFEAENVELSMFATQWLMTVYTSVFSFDLVSKVWDNFLVEGWVVVYRVL